MDNKGNTIIELLLVLAIMSLITAIAMPRFLLSDNAKLEMEAAQVASELRYMQELTYSMQPVHSDFSDVPAEARPQFMIDAGSKQYYIKIGGKSRHFHTFPAKMKISTNRKDIYFSADGNAQTTTIVLSLNNKFKYVIIDLAGRIRVSNNSA